MNNKYDLNEKAKKQINEQLLRVTGITYDEFKLLDFDVQQKLIEKNRNKKFNDNKNIKVMIGSGEYAIFINKKCGEKYMLEDGTLVRVGITPKKAKEKLDNRVDDALYSKPVAFTKRLIRKIKK